MKSNSIPSMSRTASSVVEPSTRESNQATVAASGHGLTRREAIKFLGRGAVAAGVVASGVVRIPVASAQESSQLEDVNENRLRSVAWSSGEFYGLVGSGPDVANIQRLVLEGSTLRVDQEVIAEVGVSAGPVLMAVDADRNQFVVVRDTNHVLREFTYSFDLSDDLAKWFEDEGAPDQEAPTSGTGIFRESVIRPLVSMVGLGGGQVALPLAGSLPEVSLEPAAVCLRPEGYQLVATSSGRYGTETNLADEVVVISLSKKGAISGLRPVATRLGHGVTEVRAFETGLGGFTVSVRTPETTRFYSDSGGGHFAEVSSSSSLNRFAAHDRVAVSGLADGWLAEVSPGVFALESSLD